MTEPERLVAIYARVSTEKQDAEPQLDRLRDWAAHQGFTVAHEGIETASGRLVRRPEQDKIMKLVKGRHVHAVAVVKLDRWGRSIIDLRNSIDVMVENGVTFHAVESGIVYEKHTATGRLQLNTLSSFAEFEADLISDRTKDGLEAARARGIKLGRRLDPCYDCGGDREEPLRARRNGIRRPVCSVCKKKG